MNTNTLLVIVLVSLFLNPVVVVVGFLLSEWYDNWRYGADWYKREHARIWGNEP